MAAALARTRIGIIGAGAMGGALIGGMLAKGVPKKHLRASDPDAERRRRLEAQFGVAVHEGNAALVNASDLVILAVKPNRVDLVLSELATGCEKLGAPLWVSIAAGVSLAQLAEGLPAGARIVRAMPNTPALVGAGAAAFVANPACATVDRERCRALFECVGVVWEAPDEALLDAVTGLSGSGPAYLFLLLEALIEAGEAQGIPADASKLLATQTVFGAAKLASESDQSAAALRKQVSSPGGTTLAGLERLTTAGFREALAAAVTAATKRSRELGKRS